MLSLLKLRFRKLTLPAGSWFVVMLLFSTFILVNGHVYIMTCIETKLLSYVIQLGINYSLLAASMCYIYSKMLVKLFSSISDRCRFIYTGLFIGFAISAIYFVLRNLYVIGNVVHKIV